MFIAGIAIASIASLGFLKLRRTRATATLLAFALVVPLLLLGESGGAGAAIVPAVDLGTTATYAVLGGTTVTNTGASVLNGSLGLSPGTSITGFPPGLVVPPGTTDATNAVAAQAQADLTIAYNDAAGRSTDATTTADLANLNLKAGVYSGPNKSALGLNGTLILDGNDDPSSVFIFQSDSTLITGSNSTITLINGAQECNVYWQVGSSATLGTGSDFTGNILALISITVDNGTVVHGRALARNGAVTLDTDTFVTPTCDTQPTTTTSPTTTDTTTPSSTAPDTTAPDTTAPDTTAPTTQPDTTMPATTMPATTIPDTTIPDTTMPVTTIPDTTMPVTTIPDTTMPVTTIPATTMPATTIPATTMPATTMPATTTTTTTTTIPTSVEATTTTTVPGNTSSSTRTGTPGTATGGSGNGTTGTGTTGTGTSGSTGTSTGSGTGTTGALARTGAPISGTALVGLVLLALGLVLVAVRRRPDHGPR